MPATSGTASAGSRGSTQSALFPLCRGRGAWPIRTDWSVETGRRRRFTLNTRVDAWVGIRLIQGRNASRGPRARSYFLCRCRFKSFRCLCLRIFLRRFLMTLPTAYSPCSATKYGAGPCLEIRLVHVNCTDARPAVTVLQSLARPSRGDPCAERSTLRESTHQLAAGGPERTIDRVASRQKGNDRESASAQ